MAARSSATSGMHCMAATAIGLAIGAAARAAHTPLAGQAATAVDCLADHCRGPSGEATEMAQMDEMPRLLEARQI